MPLEGIYVGVTVLEAVLTFAETLPQEKRSRMQRRDAWCMLMTVCLDQELREDFLSTPSVSQINSLRVLLLWKAKAFNPFRRRGL